MFHKRFALCSAAAVLAVAVACSNTSETPVSPNSSPPPSGDAAPDGSNLKVTQAVPQSPINGAQPSSVTLVAGTSSALFPVVALPPLTYEFQVMTATGTLINACSGTATPSGNTVSFTPTCTFDFDTNHRWRLRPRLSSNPSVVGSWSAEATFRSPIGGYINGNEVYDPLYNGQSVGTRVNSTTFVQNVGLRLNTHESRVEYLLSPNLQQGEISVMVTGIDEGNPGDKTKIFAMQEGNDNDITDDDYRMTAEKRGREYETPGATTWRIITGDAHPDHGRIFDGHRLPVSYSDERWYFWRFEWRVGFARLQVRENGPTGRVIYDQSSGTGPFPYRPVPHYAYLGSQVGRAGAGDASIPGAIYKNLWISSRPRPAFPNE